MLCMSSFKFKKYLINSNEEKVETTIFQTRKGSMLVVSDQIWLKLELIQALLHFPINWKYHTDWIENDQENVETPFSPI